MTTWTAIVVLAAGTFLIRAAAPVALARIAVPPRVEAAIGLIAPALLAALIGVSTVTTGRAFVVDARAAGVAVALAAAWLRLPLPVVIAAAMITTAGLRAVW